MRRTAWVLAAWLACSLPSVGTISFAAPPARDDPSAEADAKAAKIHYQAGEQYYLRGHYTESIGEFNEAYRLSHAAALLYNISQAYERMGDLPRAREYMQRYLDSGQAEPGELPALREKLRILDQRVAEQKSARRRPTGLTPPTGEAPPLAPVPESLRVERPRPYKTWKWIAAGSGAGCLVLSALFAADANTMAKDLESVANQATKSPYVGDLPDKYARGERDEKLAIAFGLGGLALAATGIVLFIMDSSSGAEAVPTPGRAQILPLLGPGTAGASAAIHF